MKKHLLTLLFTLSLAARLAADVSAVRYDLATGALILDPDGAQFVDWPSAEFKINSTQLVATGKTVSFANSLAFAGTDGKTLTVSQNLVLTGTSGKILTLSGDLTIGADTTITGGGTIALGGFTFTVPGNGTAVLTSRTVTAGAGLTGGGDLSADRTFNIGAGAGITVNADDVALTTPGSVSISSTNSSSGSHTHAITSSSNPGAAASILATDPSGYLRLVRFGIGVAPTQPLHVAGNAFIDAATANLLMKDTSTGWQVASTQVITPQTGNSLRNTSYTSGVNGWNCSDGGDCEFDNVRVRGELAASVFKVNEISATAGTLGVFYSAATLFFDYTTPASTGSSATFEAKNSDAGAMLFAVGDIVRLKSWTGAGISDAWLEVAGRSNNGATTSYFATLRSGSASATFRAGTAVVDYGPSGTGFITLSTDGTVGSTPNLTMATHAGSPWSAFTTLLRLGNLNGSYGYATNTYGLGVGQYGVVSNTWFTLDLANGFRIGNNSATLAKWDASGNILVGQTGAGQSNVYITSGAVDLRNDTTSRIHLASDGSGYLANSNISWDASGNATIAGWSINSGYLAKDTGTNSTSAGMAPSDYPFFAGSTYANRATAPFRVTPAGAVTATNATITGSVTASSGSITGPLTISGASGSIAIGTTPPTSATAGTGVWLDRTGLYSLSSNTQNAIFDSNGITAGGGNVLLTSTGLSLIPGTVVSQATSVNWITGGNIVAQQNAVYSGSGGPALIGGAILPAANTSGGATSGIRGANDLGHTAYVTANSNGSTHSGGTADKAWVTISGSNSTAFKGLFVGPFTLGTVPSYMLEVYGTGWFQSDVNMATKLMVGSSGAPLNTFQVHASTDWNLGIRFNGTSVGLGSYNDAGSASVAMHFDSSAFTFLTGNVRFANYGAGTLTTDASGNITASSDERLKDIDGKFTRSLADLRGIQPISYHWKASTGLDRTESYSGLSAQNVLANIPEAIGLAPDGTYSVTDRSIIATLINAVNELDAKLEAVAAGKKINPRPPDSQNRQKLATDRSAQLQARLQLRKAAEPKPRATPVATPTAKPVKK